MTLRERTGRALELALFALGDPLLHFVLLAALLYLLVRRD